MNPARLNGNRIVLGRACDVRETASKFYADPHATSRILDALDPLPRMFCIEHMIAAATERTRRHFAKRSCLMGNKYARVAYAWFMHRKWTLLKIPRRTFFHALRKVKDFFHALKTGVECTFASFVK